jgi:hypothetical protein
MGAGERSHPGHCPLCDSTQCGELAVKADRAFVACPACSLVFVPPRFHLPPERERARYALHDNTADNPGYVDYLRQFRATLAALPIVNPSVLDFGSGAEYVLTRLLREEGIDACAYDPLYGVGAEALDRTYDIVVLCEVIEHLRDLRAELALVRRCCAPGGWVAIRTEPYGETTDFAAWWYAQDPTHVNFFHRATLSVVGKRLGRKVAHTSGRNVFLFG